MTPRRYRMDTRAAAVADTRRRIVEAAYALHDEQGILATTWEDIARRADVALATVYRHYPSLDELVPACGQLVHARLQPPDPASAPELFAGLPTLADRVARLVREVFGCYERGALQLHVARREMHAIPTLAAFIQELDGAFAVLVQEALRPARPDESTVRLVGALISFPLWETLLERQIPKGEIDDVVTALVLSVIPTPDHHDRIVEGETP